jgi:hypothetical protein
MICFYKKIGFIFLKIFIKVSFYYLISILLLILILTHVIICLLPHAAVCAPIAKKYIYYEAVSFNFFHLKCKA